MDIPIPYTHYPTVPFFNVLSRDLNLNGNTDVDEFQRRQKNVVSRFSDSDVTKALLGVLELSDSVKWHSNRLNKHLKFHFSVNNCYIHVFVHWANQSAQVSNALKGDFQWHLFDQRAPPSFKLNHVNFSDYVEDEKIASYQLTPFDINQNLLCTFSFTNQIGIHPGKDVKAGFKAYHIKFISSEYIQSISTRFEHRNGIEWYSGPVKFHSSNSNGIPLILDSHTKIFDIIKEKIYKPFGSIFEAMAENRYPIDSSCECCSTDPNRLRCWISKEIPFCPFKDLIFPEINLYSSGSYGAIRRCHRISSPNFEMVVKYPIENNATQRLNTIREAAILQLLSKTDWNAFITPRFFTIINQDILESEINETGKTKTEPLIGFGLPRLPPGAPFVGLLDTWKHHSIDARFQIFKSLVRTVQILHEYRIYHLDLHGGNLWVSLDHQVFVIDFGTGKVDLPSDPIKIPSSYNDQETLSEFSALKNIFATLFKKTLESVVQTLPIEETLHKIQSILEKNTATVLKDICQLLNVECTKLTHLCSGNAHALDSKDAATEVSINKSGVLCRRKITQESHLADWCNENAGPGLEMPIAEPVLGTEFKPGIGYTWQKGKLHSLVQHLCPLCLESFKTNCYSPFPLSKSSSDQDSKSNLNQLV
ncbi:MAG: hypothetical protein Sylvanvirus22_2 [Sylvanvirus sp.]|uniref:Protein kinase domain-containing protein n=1 Tax=Sylvanvirus sp. TaxID=2487774 RepID=A0A3G5AL67_9VIRU|nr:MAG: hypothetical protein Sylvanvirus22_2 [Sylvanvirus sp.]